MVKEYPIRSYPYRVFYADTDAGGVMYYAQYLRLFEQARTLYLEDCGLSVADLAADNLLFVCRRAEIDYRTPAVLGDRLEIRTNIAEISRTQIVFHYQILCPQRKDEEGNPLRIAEGITRMAAVRSREGRAVLARIPKEILEALE